LEPFTIRVPSLLHLRLDPKRERRGERERESRGGRIL
jgi:hypothetical protein